MHCAAECCSALQCVALCCGALQCMPRVGPGHARSVLQYVAVCCSVLQCVAVCCSVLQYAAVCHSVLERITVCCCVLQCDAAAHTPEGLCTPRWTRLQKILGSLRAQTRRLYDPVCVTYHVYICDLTDSCVWVAKEDSRFVLRTNSRSLQSCMVHDIFMCVMHVCNARV